MNESQYQNFISICKKNAKELKFVNPRVMNILLSNYTNSDKTNNDEMILKHVNIAKEVGVGVNFTMACVTLDILRSMGLSGYIVEYYNKSWFNFSVLYKCGDEYLICDLASEVRKYDAVFSYVVNKGEDPNAEITKNDTEKIVSLLSSDSNLNMNIKDYFEKYDKDSCKVVEYDKNTSYDKLPRINVLDFIEKIEKGNILIKKTSF